jgi:two-component system chemotaxis response regulator CheB
VTATRGSNRTVLIVDDSAFMRKLIAEMIADAPGYIVAGFARDGVDAIAQVQSLNPDIVTLDLEMPRLDGMRVLRRIMSDFPRPVIVLSAGGAQYGDATLRALELGAVDFVRKPSGPVSLDLPVIRDRLMLALEAASRATLTAPAIEIPAANRAPVTTHREPQRPANHVVVIASSTGGPRALAEIIPQLPATLDAAVVVAQHLPAEFTAALADRLARSSSIAVCEAEPGMKLFAATVYVARGGVNTVLSGLAGCATLEVQESVPRSGAAPSADVLFESAARIFGQACTGVVLTGMGRDGSAGLRQIRAGGGRAIVQDESSSAIYGMPRAALAEAGADQVVSLSMVASAIIGMVPEERLEWLTA